MSSNRATPKNIIVADVKLAGFASLDAALPTWRKLEESSFPSYYQTINWAQAWTSTMGKAASVTPYILVGTCTQI
ncbi:MAG: hypothetical protein KGO94_12985, partial [Alphaproteobacteria bacterium]|nr:hypothetical protein [Alphaproteobacteria bacterium]